MLKIALFEEEFRNDLGPLLGTSSIRDFNHKA